jgi:hypothetical protein
MVNLKRNFNGFRLASSTYGSNAQGFTDALQTVKLASLR